MGKRNVFLCDIGRVVVDFDNERAKRQLRALAGQVIESDWEQLIEGPIWSAYGNGEISDLFFRDQVRKALGCAAAVTDEQIDQAVADVFTPIGETIAILEQLRAEGVQLIALSNAEPPRVRQLERMEIWDLFDGRIASCDVRCSKPVPEIYHRALALAGVSANEAMFTDDVLAYVQAAEALGIAGHQFRGSAGLVAFLQSHGHLFAADLMASEG